MKINNNGFALPLLLLVVGLLGAVGYLSYKNNTWHLNPPIPTTYPLASVVPSGDPTASWKTYTNSYWGITLRYPSEMLTTCSDYSSEEKGVRFYESGYNCALDTDVFNKIALTGYAPGKYKEYKIPLKTEKINVDGAQATKKVYQYDESDGPLYEFKESLEIVIPNKKGILALYLLGTDANDIKAFNQILSTFKFNSDVMADWEIQK
jgi:hypothetical protein